jgi:hypothetical protein
VYLVLSERLVLAFGDGACLMIGDRLVETLLNLEYFLGVLWIYFLSSLSMLNRFSVSWAKFSLIRLGGCTFSYKLDVISVRGLSCLTSSFVLGGVKCPYSYLFS